MAARTARRWVAVAQALLCISLPVVLLLTSVRLLLTPAFVRLDYGLPGFPQVLRAVAEAWRHRRGEVLVSSRRLAAELGAPILLAPVLFVYGELLPKNLFLQAPNRLLRLVAAPLLVLAAVLLPASLLLWGLSRLLARWLGESTEAIRLRLARGELRRALEEGQEAGILQPVQQALADAVFQLGNRPVAPMAVPPDRVARARADMARDEVLRLARRYRLSVIPVESAKQPGKLDGYYRTIDVLLAGDDRMPDVLPLPEVLADEPHLAALARLHNEQAAMARVVDRRGQIVGVVTLEQLREPLWRAGA